MDERMFLRYLWGYPFDLSLIISNPKEQIFNPSMSILTPQWRNKCNEAHNVKFYSNPNPSECHVGMYGPTYRQTKNQGPVVQSVVSLTTSLRVISLTVLADSIYIILIFFAEKMWVAFALQKLLTFFQQKISAYLRITRCKF